MTAHTDTVAALAALLPLAKAHTDALRTIATTAATFGQSADVATHYAARADEATHAITAARLALQAEHAAAHHAAQMQPYDVMLAVAMPHSYFREHRIRVLAECADDAQRAAIEACEAAGLVHGNVLRIRRACL